MSQTPAPAPRTPSPWWVLLLVPAGLLAGWLVAQLPGPKPQDVKPVALHGDPSRPAHVDAAPAAPAKHEVASDAGTPPAAAAAAPLRAIEMQTPDPASGPISDWTTLDAAIVESRRTGKPVLIDFNAEWCGPCRALKEQVFDDWTLGKEVRTAVVPVSIVDRAREEGRNPPEIEELQQRFQVDAFPTLVVFSPQSGRAVRTQGFGGAERTMQWITGAVDAVR